MINIKNRYLPTDTQEILQKIPAENFAYIYNLPDIYDRDRRPEKIRIKEGIENYRWNTQLILYISKRIESSINLFKNCGFQFDFLKLTLSWRMVIGLGASHPQETSMTLHHIYGIPYIPGSAVKGVTRHCLISMFAEEYSKQQGISDFNEALAKIESAFDNSEKSLNIKIKDTSFSDIVDIFGTQSKVGKVVFFDAFPVDEIKLKLDVMTPHYGDYYSDISGKTPPADWLSPNPIKFLTVERTRFRFYLASKEENLLDKAKEWLKEALQNYGIGAKTAIGYGYFDII